MRLVIQFKNACVMSSHCIIVVNLKLILQSKPFPREFNVTHEKTAKNLFIVNAAEEMFGYLTTDINFSCISFLASPHRYGKPCELCKQM